MRIRSTLGAGTTVVVRLPLDGRPAENGKRDAKRIRGVTVGGSAPVSPAGADLLAASRIAAIRRAGLVADEDADRNKVRP